MGLAPEGHPFVALAAALALAAWITFALGALGWVAPALATVFTLDTLMAVWFFRDPVPDPPYGIGYVLSPAQGKVVSIQEEREPDFIGARARRISIFLSVFDVHVQRAPIGGVVAYRAEQEGRFLSAWSDRASRENASASTGILAMEGKVLVRQVAGLVARRIVTDHAEGSRIRRGQRIGLIRFGSRVDVFIPHHWPTACQVGDRVKVGESVLAHVHSWPSPTNLRFGPFAYHKPPDPEARQ